MPGPVNSFSFLDTEARGTTVGVALLLGTVTPVRCLFEIAMKTIMRETRTRPCRKPAFEMPSHIGSAHLGVLSRIDGGEEVSKKSKLDGPDG